MDFSIWEMFVGAAFLLHAGLVPSLAGAKSGPRHHWQANVGSGVQSGFSPNMRRALALRTAYAAPFRSSGNGKEHTWCGLQVGNLHTTTVVSPACKVGRAACT